MPKLSQSYKNWEISSGTLITEDLMSKILTFISSEAIKEKYDPFVTCYIQGINRDMIESMHDYEFIQELYEELVDVMNEIAPEGCFFGMHEGDGASLGFWECQK